MKNQEKCWQALLDGEILTNGNIYYKFKGGELKYSSDKNNITNRMIEGFNVLTKHDDFEIYKEPKWYENIPDGGVLCWFTDGLNRYTDIVAEYQDNKVCNQFKLADGTFRDFLATTPLTKQEIQVFMDNAPE